MDERATGLILRIYPLTETSLIVHWLTAEQGRLATVAKGARRPKSPFRGKLDLYFLGDFSFARSRRSELHTLRELTVRETHSGLRRSLAALQQVAYCAALTEQNTETETPIPAQFELLAGLLQTLTSQPPRPLIVFAFELKLLAELGLWSMPEQNPLSPGAQLILEKALALDWGDLAHIQVSPTQTAQVRNFLQGYLSIHLGRVPANRGVALGF